MFLANIVVWKKQQGSESRIENFKIPRRSFIPYASYMIYENKQRQNIKQELYIQWPIYFFNIRERNAANAYLEIPTPTQQMFTSPSSRGSQFSQNVSLQFVEIYRDAPDLLHKLKNEKNFLCSTYIKNHVKQIIKRSKKLQVRREVHIFPILYIKVKKFEVKLIRIFFSHKTAFSLVYESWWTKVYHRADYVYVAYVDANIDIVLCHCV